MTCFNSGFVNHVIGFFSYYPRGISPEKSLVPILNTSERTRPPKNWTWTAACSRPRFSYCSSAGTGTGQRHRSGKSPFSRTLADVLCPGLQYHLSGAASLSMASIQYQHQRSEDITHAYDAGAVRLAQLPRRRHCTTSPPCHLLAPWKARDGRRRYIAIGLAVAVTHGGRPSMEQRPAGHRLHRRRC